MMLYNLTEGVPCKKCALMFFVTVITKVFKLSPGVNYYWYESELL